MSGLHKLQIGVFAIKTITYPFGEIKFCFVLY